MKLRPTFQAIVALTLFIALNSTLAFAEEAAPSPEKPNSAAGPLIGQVGAKIGGSRSGGVAGGTLVFDPRVLPGGGLDLMPPFTVKIDGVGNDHSSNVKMGLEIFKMKTKNEQYQLAPMAWSAHLVDDRGHSSSLTTAQLLKLIRTSYGKMGETDIRTRVHGALSMTNQRITDGNVEKTAEGMGALLGADFTAARKLTDKDALELKLAVEMIAALSGKVGPVHTYEGELLWKRAIRDGSKSKMFAGFEANQTDFSTGGTVERNNFAGFKTGVLY